MPSHLFTILLHCTYQSPAPSLPRARGKGALAPPVADKARTPFPQRSKIPRISASPTGFSGTARWIGGPLCVPCGYAVDEVPAKRILDSIVPCQVRQKLRPIVFQKLRPLVLAYALILLLRSQVAQRQALVLLRTVSARNTLCGILHYRDSLYPHQQRQQPA